MTKQSSVVSPCFPDRDLVYFGTSVGEGRHRPLQSILNSHLRHFNSVTFIAQGDIDCLEKSNDKISIAKVRGYLGRRLGKLQYLLRLPLVYWKCSRFLKNYNNPLVYLSLPSPFALSLLPLILYYRFEVVPIIKGDWSDNVSSKFPILHWLGISGFFNWILGRVVGKFTIAVTAGDELARKFRGKRATHIWRGTTHNLVVRRSDSRARTIGFLGRLDSQKRPLDLVMAMARLRSRGATDMRLRIAGNGALEEQTANLVSKHNLGDYVEMLGWLATDGEVEKFLDSIDIMVLASESEGTPKVIPESMSRGCVIVSTPVGDVPQMIKDSENGLLFGVGDVVKLADCLFRLYSTPELVLKLREGSHTYATSHTLDSEVDSVWAHVSREQGQR